MCDIFCINPLVFSVLSLAPNPTRVNAYKGLKVADLRQKFCAVFYYKLAIFITIMFSFCQNFPLYDLQQINNINGM